MNTKRRTALVAIGVAAGVLSTASAAESSLAQDEAVARGKCVSEKARLDAASAAVQEDLRTSNSRAAGRDALELEMAGNAYDACFNRARSEATWQRMNQAVQERAARAAEAAAEAEKERVEREKLEAAIEKAQEDPDIGRLVWSAVICSWEADRRNAKDEIRQEQKYAAEGGGIVDMRLLHEGQQKMRRADERIERAKAAMADRKLKPMGCQTDKVRAIAFCIALNRGVVEDRDESGCDLLIARVLVATAGRVDPQLAR